VILVGTLILFGVVPRLALDPIDLTTVSILSRLGVL
jgi:hypothetical protein